MSAKSAKIERQKQQQRQKLFRHRSTASRDKVYADEIAMQRNAPQQVWIEREGERNAGRGEETYAIRAAFWKLFVIEYFDFCVVPGVGPNEFRNCKSRDSKT
ncbi:MAG TPA: hypothetical protein VKD65_02605 [Candidatus Angelobacter sp.]|nr:hypothetical protein [Candidatus Angelobacter sp.]HKE30587.1 hypothetical protein [Candidatus Angelobacter sp.]